MVSVSKWSMTMSAAAKDHILRQTSQGTQGGIRASSTAVGRVFDQAEAELSKHEVHLRCSRADLKRLGARPRSRAPPLAADRCGAPPRCYRCSGTRRERAPLLYSEAISRPSRRLRTGWPWPLCSLTTRCLMARPSVHERLTS